MWLTTSAAGPKTSVGDTGRRSGLIGGAWRIPTPQPNHVVAGDLGAGYKDINLSFLSIVGADA
ncbi:hypothetical protein [Mycobacterium sp.]|uniref:hypothetical protein n=1 Tax=Mycobacterium sp. TaxID=1785 RepID=UPI0026160392|nr:hypothetical protein [Mycobacterium sp.]